MGRNRWPALAGLALLACMSSAYGVMAPPKNEAELDAMADQGRVKEAITALEAYVRAHPKHDPQRLLLARAYVEDGEVEKAGEQYQWILQHSAFPASKEKARTELARMNEVPEIPVQDPTPPPATAPVAKVPEEPGFNKEKTMVGASTTLSAGYDTNANSGSNFDRYFFFDLMQTRLDSHSTYGLVGVTGEGSYAFSDTLALRGGVAADARENFSAHFADTQDASAEVQLRWAGAQQRFSTGLAYSHSWFGNDELNHALALVNKLEILTRKISFDLGGEAARVRYAYEPLRDVDSFVMRGHIEPIPAKDAVWQPTATVFTGFEEETHDESPFGRSLWGISTTLTRLLGRGFSAEADAGYTKSMFNGNFSSLGGSGERRSDDRKEGGVYLHWRPDEKSRWQHTLGATYTRNDSSEPTFDFGRLVGGYTLKAIWGGG